MEKSMGTLALVAAFALGLAAAQRVAGIQWPVALVLLIGGALAAGFASSIGKAALAGSDDDRPAIGKAAGLILRILIGALAIARMVTGGLWWVARSWIDLARVGSNPPLFVSMPRNPRLAKGAPLPARHFHVSTW